MATRTPSWCIRPLMTAAQPRSWLQRSRRRSTRGGPGSGLGAGCVYLEGDQPNLIERTNRSRAFQHACSLEHLAPTAPDASPLWEGRTWTDHKVLTPPCHQALDALPHTLGKLGLCGSTSSISSSGPTQSNCR